jgi:hypothetical protein
MNTSRMTEDDVLFGYPLQLFDLAARTTVSHPCRTFGVRPLDLRATSAGSPAARRAGQGVPRAPCAIQKQGAGVGFWRRRDA